MKNRKVKFGMLGCGRVAEHYRIMLNEIDPIESIDIVACCDIDKVKAKNMSIAFQCNSYYSYSDMLNSEEIDVVLIMTPSGDHFSNAKYALNHGINVLIEKPITMRVGEAIELGKFSKKRGLICASIFQNRYNPAIVELKNAMESDRFGKIISASIRLRWCRYQDYYEDGWHGTWAKDGGVINQQAIHHIDALNWICGPVKSTVAKMKNRLNNLEAEDTMVALVNFSNGSVGTIETTTAARPKDFEASLSVVGEKGTVQIGGIALNKIDEWFFIDKLEIDDNIRTLCDEEVPTGYGLSHTRQLREFIDCFLTGSIDAPVSVEDCIPTIQLIHALYASVEDNSWVELANKPKSMRLGIG